MLLFVWFCLFVCVLCSWQSTTRLIRVSCCSLADRLPFKRNLSKMIKMWKMWDALLTRLRMGVVALNCNQWGFCSGSQEAVGLWQTQQAASWNIIVQKTGPARQVSFRIFLNHPSIWKPSNLTDLATTKMSNRTVRPRSSSLEIFL